MYKKDIINFVFASSFPFYGLISHIGRSTGPAFAITASWLPYLFIVVFYLVDILYKRDFQIKVKRGIYWWMIAYISSVSISLFVANYKGTPLVSTATAMGSTIFYFLVFHAFVIVFLYNGSKSDDVVPRLTLISLGILMLLNIVGFYGLGLHVRPPDSEDDRSDLPFFRFAVEGGTMAVVLFFLVIWQIRKMRGKSLKVFGLVIALIVLLFIIIEVNSRISSLLMILTLGLFAAKIAKNQLVYWMSLLTLPIVLNASYVLYQIMTLPVLKPLMVRTDPEDLLSFNGRTYIWSKGIDWMLYDQRGLFFGLGHGGQYFIGILRDLQMLIHPTNPGIMHFHSATMEILVNQGLLGLVLLLIVLYHIFNYYREKFEKNSPMGMFFIAIVFLLFNVQIDTFILFGSTGTLIFWLLVAGAAVKTSPSGKIKASNFSEVEAMPV